MIELSTTPVFAASDPVEAIAFDAKALRLAVTSQHGHIKVFTVDKAGVCLKYISALV